MRLLEVLPNGDFRLTEWLLDNAIPRYAILSHTWGDMAQEVTFDDMNKGSGQDKAGYKKIKFCGEQATRDGLQYFWVDSCCINKSSDAELSESLNSMFRWYSRAEKCYAYLSDVSTRKRKREDNTMQNSLDQAFRESRWFTRGWTLQELLAPSSVVFFTLEGTQYGDKQSLKQQIHEITGIPISALSLPDLSQFSTEQKFDWAKNRQTTRAEDWVYSLLGIFRVSMPVIYGEGRTNALKRLRKEIDDVSKDQECLRDLFVTDPCADKIRIEETKGGLIADSYYWILENPDFKQWRNDPQSHLLWIKGDPGKGKTMLLCGIIDDLKKSIAATHLLSFFYCQATDQRINNATAVLRSLLFLLIDQQPSLISHIQKHHNHKGKALFEDANAWVALSDIFTNVLQDPSLKSTYFIIDALDECTIDQSKLLDFIIQKSSLCPHVKWLVSSRNWPPIEQQLDKIGSKASLSLELNTESVSAAVSTYICHKVNQLAQDKKYNDETRDAVSDYLSSNANNTFLWVALVCQNLKNIPRGRVCTRLNSFPPGLDSLYERMMNQIRESKDSELCKGILATIATVYEPVTLAELASLVDMLDELSGDLESLQELIGLCGSFLILRGDKIYFVHQSVKDYLLTKASVEIFPSGKGETHYKIFSRSLEVMSKTLRPNIYGLGLLGYPIGRVKKPDLDPLMASRYSCIHWVQHLSDGDVNSHPNQMVDLQDGGMLDVFLRKTFLNWLEALSLCRSVREGVNMMWRLRVLVKRRANRLALLELVREAHRFIVHHQDEIQISPLQTYVAALVFSPASSLIRGHLKNEEPKCMTTKPNIEDKGNPLQCKLMGNSFVMIVAFSPNSAWLASASSDNTIKIWDTSSGKCRQTLRGYRSPVRTIAFSNDSARLVSVSEHSTRFEVKIWDVISGKCQEEIDVPNYPAIALSHDSSWLAISGENEIMIRDIHSAKFLLMLEGHWRSLTLAFSHDSALLASVSKNWIVTIWETRSGNRLHKFKTYRKSPSSVTFSHDLARLVLTSDFHGTLEIWDTSNGKCLHSFQASTVFFDTLFDATGSYLYTILGTIDLGASSSNMITIVEDPQNPYVIRCRRLMSLF